MLGKVPAVPVLLFRAELTGAHWKRMQAAYLFRPSLCIKAHTCLHLQSTTLHMPVQNTEAYGEDEEEDADEDALEDEDEEPLPDSMTLEVCVVKEGSDDALM